MGNLSHQKRLAYPRTCHDRIDYPPAGRTTRFASPKTHVSRYRRLYLVVDNVSHAPHVESQHTLIREIINRLMISGERMVIARIH